MISANSFSEIPYPSPGKMSLRIVMAIETLTLFVALRYSVSVILHSPKVGSHSHVSMLSLDLLYGIDILGRLSASVNTFLRPKSNLDY